ncbi:hypothetical protein SAMN05421684_3407 [Asanoa ishikariensis]|uniref:Acyl-CoA thioesterase n=1 Tax=Asanoa ishikariensis TaxID=137265 RepID=A0A1H3R3J4_9ACTN|nr:hypothetical protein [Asanoa ishikariensis]SDZ19871.1 hypothetical protein SAMN05421684_3407 [Asanoa ishikariensis]
MVIASRFNGPPGTGNGGYSAGTFAALVDEAGVPEVTLLKPPPLDVPLTADGGAVLDPAGQVVATARAVPEFDVVAPRITIEAATEAAARYAGFTDHPFPTCYVCGPERADGLRIFPGPVDGVVAAPFTAPAQVSTETVWSALDCPGGWSVLAPGRAYVLGRMATMIAEPPAPGSESVVVGMLSATEGRKAAVHSALYDSDGRLLAHARATWLAI